VKYRTRRNPKPTAAANEQNPANSVVVLLMILVMCSANFYYAMTDAHIETILRGKSKVVTRS
jgi:hypothetical protein